MNQRIECPSCRKYTLRKSHGKNMIDREWFCDNEHIYFGTWELVTQWGLDAGDFGLENRVPQMKTLWMGKITIPSFFSHQPPNVVDVCDLDTMSNSGEPLWANEKERDEAYEVVHRMFLGIPEWNDYNDLKETQECALDRGIQ